MAKFSYDLKIGQNGRLEYDENQILPPQYLETEPYTDVEKIDEDEYSKFSVSRDEIRKQHFLGMAIFMPVAFVYLDEGGKEQTLVMPNEPSLQISVSKTVNKTKIVGNIGAKSQRDGSVIDHIHLNDYDIILRGIAIEPQSRKVYPEDMIFDIHELAKLGQSVRIKSGLTALLGINYVLIESMELPAMVGVQNAQAYELRMSSDSNYIPTEEQLTESERQEAELRKNPNYNGFRFLRTSE